jgi:hypothetical protein
MEAAVGCGKPFDRRYLSAFDLCGERQACENARAVDVDGAGAALPLVAAFLGSVQSQMVAQRIEQGDSCFERNDLRPSVDIET